MGLVQRLPLVAQQFNRLPNAPWLVNAALLANGEVHREVQKWIFAGRVNVLHGCQRRIHIGQFCVVFRVFFNPLAGQYFDGRHGGARAEFGIGPTKKSAHIGLRRLYQHARIVA